MTKAIHMYLVEFFSVLWTALTDMEVLINSLVFMLGGFDTTATTLSWLFYELVANPEIQEKLATSIYEELKYVCRHFYTSLC